MVRQLSISHISTFASHFATFANINHGSGANDECAFNFKIDNIFPLFPKHMVRETHGSGNGTCCGLLDFCLSFPCGMEEAGLNSRMILYNTRVGTCLIGSSKVQIIGHGETKGLSVYILRL